MAKRVVDVSMTGQQQLRALTQALRDAGDKDLRRELGRGLRRTGRPLISVARRAALERLPRRGGLAQRVANSRFTVKVGMGREPSVRISARGDVNLRRMDRGRVRHPVFGHPDVWVTQQIEPGWYSEPLEQAAPLVRPELVRAIDEVSRKFTAKVR